MSGCEAALIEILVSCLESSPKREVPTLPQSSPVFEKIPLLIPTKGETLTPFGEVLSGLSPRTGIRTSTVELFEAVSET